jgi:hypothetical protein
MMAGETQQQFADAHSVDLDQQRSIGQILGATLRLYRRHPLLFVSLALIVMAPYQLAVLAAVGRGPFGHSHEPFVLRSVLLAVQASLITPLISALHMHALVAIGEGRRPTFRAVGRLGLRSLPLVGAADLLASAGIYIGLIALVVPGVILSLDWAVVAQAAAIEREGVRAAFRRSSRLAGGHYLHVFCLFFIIWTVTIAIDIGAHAVHLGTGTSFPSVLAGIAVLTLLATFYALTFSLLYFDLRSRHGVVQRPSSHPRSTLKIELTRSWQWIAAFAISIPVVVKSTLHRQHYVSDQLTVRIFAAVVVCLVLGGALRLLIFAAECLLEKVTAD